MLMMKSISKFNKILEETNASDNKKNRQLKIVQKLRNIKDMAHPTLEGRPHAWEVSFFSWLVSCSLLSDWRRRLN